VSAQLAITKARALLGNSSAEILKPLQGAGGTFQVVWIEPIDAHALLYERDQSQGAVMLATHNNGFSCHVLAERIIAGDRDRALSQLEFIARCGGTSIAPQFLPIAS
jgi:hypothetical protein